MAPGNIFVMFAAVLARLKATRRPRSVLICCVFYDALAHILPARQPTWLNVYLTAYFENVWLGLYSPFPDFVQELGASLTQ
jgi:hypothetical protein